MNKEQIYNWIADIIEGCVHQEQLPSCQALANNFLTRYADEDMHRKLIGFIERVSYKLPPIDDKR